MSRNLRDKIRLVIQDAYDLNEELSLREEERLFDYQDLCYITSVAAKEFAELRHDKESLGRVFSEPEKVRTLCIVNAAVGFLRQKGLLPAIMKYTKK